MVYDRGSYLFAAQVLGEKAKKVYYCMPDTRPYPDTRLAQIGCDLPEVERISSDPRSKKFWNILDKCDWVAFFDCYDSDFQEHLLKSGMPVFGCLGSSKMELERDYFLELIKSLNLPVAKTHRVHGVSEMMEYLKDVKDVRYIKGSMRGDFETKKFKSLLQIKPWVNELKSHLGEMAEEIDILIQNHIEAACEVGSDSFNVNGIFTGNPLIGYEIKDKGYVGKVMDDYPEVIDKVLEKISPTFKKLGCQGNFSDELRIMDNGKTFFTDSTNRVPKPPGHSLCRVYKEWAENVRSIAHGEMPKLKPASKYVAEYILHSEDNIKNDLYVTFPKDNKDYVMLSNHTKEGDGYYCIPNDNGGYFGGVIGLGDTLDEAIENCKDVMSEIEADGLDYEPSIFDQAQEQIEKGEKYGIRF